MFEIDKRAEGLLLFIYWQDDAVFVEVFRSAPQPGPFGQCEHVGIEEVLRHDLFLILQQAVVPDGEDGSGDVVAALIAVVDSAVVEGHDIAEGIEVVDVVKTGVDGGNAGLCLAAVAPELCGIDLSRLVVPSGVPGDHLFT